MNLSDELSHATARPRSTRLVPRYPRHAIMMGAALSMAACMGAAPAPYQAAAPTQTGPAAPSASGDYAKPPPKDAPPPGDPVEDPEDEVVPLAGVAPQTFEP
jgi:hypothetical protein